MKKVIIPIIIMIILFVSYFYSPFLYCYTSFFMYNKRIDGCYTEFAVKENDISICEKTAYDDGCISKVRSNFNNVTQCDLLNVINNSDQKDICIYDFAIKNDDVNLCYDISEYGQKYKDSCFESFAKSKNDPDLCDEISGSLDKKMCHASIN